MTREEFIEKAKSIHGDKYNYDKVEYHNNRTKVTITCPVHGDFEQIPYDHLKGKGCKKCFRERQAKNQMFTTESFILKYKEKYGDKYDLSKVEYIGSHIKVCVICPEHGEFWITPNSLLNGRGCPRCANNVKFTKDDFIKRAKAIHGNKYDYSKVEYINNRTKVLIICPEHGEFYQTPSKHLMGRGCRLCANEKISKAKKDTFEDFTNKARKIHGEKYTYHEDTYVASNVKTKITCPKHGDFWQLPAAHLRYVGCPRCRKSTLEQNIENLLKENNLTYIDQYNIEWLGKQTLDFYLPEYNTAIECQGRQHYQPVSAFGGEDYLKITKARDLNKLNLCTEHGIKLLYYADKQYNDEIITDKQQLIEEITK